MLPKSSRIAVHSLGTGSFSASYVWAQPAKEEGRGEVGIAHMAGHREVGRETREKGVFLVKNVMSAERKSLHVLES